jgi:hypothetical protein
LASHFCRILKIYSFISQRLHPMPNPTRFSKYLDTHAKEAGHTDSEDDVSDDDRSAPDLSFVTSGDDADVDDDMMAIYAQSLSSQASAFGFGTPLCKKRSKENGIGPGSIFCGIVDRNDRKSKSRRQKADVSDVPHSIPDTGMYEPGLDQTDICDNAHTRATDLPDISDDAFLRDKSQTSPVVPPVPACSLGRVISNGTDPASCVPFTDNAFLRDKSESGRVPCVQCTYNAFPCDKSHTSTVVPPVKPYSLGGAIADGSGPATSFSDLDIGVIRDKFHPSSTVPLVISCSTLPENATCSVNSPSVPATVSPTLIVSARQHSMIVISSDSECEERFFSHSDASTQTWLN